MEFNCLSLQMKIKKLIFVKNTEPNTHGVLGKSHGLSKSCIFLWALYKIKSSETGFHKKLVLKSQNFQNHILTLGYFKKFILRGLTSWYQTISTNEIILRVAF